MSETGFLTHVEALRQVLLRAAGALLIFLIPGYYLAEKLITVLCEQAWPKDVDGALYFFTPLEPFIAQLKLGFFIALFLSLPVIAYQVYRFAAPGLYEKERLWLKWTVGGAFVLFTGGAFFCYHFMLPLLMKFAYSFANDSVRPMIGLAGFLDLAGLLLLGFGVMFEFPLAILLLIKSGMVSPETLRRQRPIVLVVILIAAAILTPPDVISQVLLAAPTYLLFEAALLLGRFIAPSPAPEEAREGIDSPPPSPQDEAASVPDDHADDAPYRNAGRKKNKIRYMR